MNTKEKCVVREKMKALSVYGKIAWLQYIGIAGRFNIVIPSMQGTM